MRQLQLVFVEDRLPLLDRLILPEGGGIWGSAVIEGVSSRLHGHDIVNEVCSGGGANDLLSVLRTALE